MLYEKAAWDCLLTNDPPFEPSPSSLKAIILIIYGRIHRGEDVFDDIQLAYRTAMSSKCHIDTRQCGIEHMVCEEYRCLLISLKLLSFLNVQVHKSILNAQVHNYDRNRDLTQDIERLADTYESTGESPTTQMAFTIVNLQLLQVSDKISARAGVVWRINVCLDHPKRVVRNCWD